MKSADCFFSSYPVLGLPFFKVFDEGDLSP